MKSITLMASLLIAGIAVGEEKQQPLTIGRILPKATSTEVSKEKPTLKIKPSGVMLFLLLLKEAYFKINMYIQYQLM